MRRRTSLEISRRRVLRGGAAAGAALATAAVRPGEAAEQHPVVATTHGPVRGFRDGGVRVFRGIRYGADTAATRFQPPRAPAPWVAVQPAYEYGPAAPQRNTPEAIDEDCLFLNVWTPASEPGARRPVMFYVHGGAYSHGSGASPLYDGRSLAQHQDVVVVTVNHRLNAFGYLYLQRFAPAELADAGNVGQLDLVLALRWVRDNIAAFGGDPRRVLAFGQSGGGAKIATLMAMPAAAGLFHRVATMSGQQVTASGPQNATQRTRAFLGALGLGPAGVERLRSLSMERLVEAQVAPDPVLPYGSIHFGPVLDMRSLTRHPFWPDAPSQSAAIPMIIGNTRNETTAFLQDDRYYDLAWNDLPELLVANMRVDIRPEFVVDRYRALYPDHTPTQIFFAATTAARSWRGAIIEAEARAREDGSPTYAYQLDWGSPMNLRLGATHTLDIPLVFGNLSAEGSITGMGAEARAVSAMMSGAFAAFARDGEPCHPALPKWRPYRLPSRDTLLIDVPPRMENDPRGAEREIFARVPYVQPGT